MKTIAIVVAAVMMSAACATAPVAPPQKKILSCNADAQWFTYNDGKPTAAVFICFADNGDLVYQAVKLTPAQIAALLAKQKPAPKPIMKYSAEKPSPKAADKTINIVGGVAAAPIGSPEHAAAVAAMADPCAEMGGDAYTRCRIAQRAAKAPGEGLKAVK